MANLIAHAWDDYELIDCGNAQKLERFGKIITIRPEPIANWKPNLDAENWKQQAHLQFIETGKNTGDWKKLQEVPNEWKVNYTFTDGKKIKLLLQPTGFKHLGIFPEQATNWDFIYNCTKKFSNAKVLNLFAYTGAASITAKLAGADVTHVDSIKQIVTWSNQNMQLSALDGIRWVIEDAVKFVNRELKRGNKYNGIILDPPAFGHGPKGERWKLRDHINELLEKVFLLLDEKYFLVINTYTPGFNSKHLKQILSEISNDKIECGELCLKDKYGKVLPVSTFARATVN